MKFEELDIVMRQFEQAQDVQLAPETYVVARLDGRGFTRLTKELLGLERPFDVRFRDAMIAVVERLMTCGFSVPFVHTQSDEISVLLDKSEDAFGRVARKWTSLLAAEASGVFSIRIGQPAAFDCRLIPLPSIARVVDYFRWRSEDAHRNALSAWCYWTLREEGQSAGQATSMLEGASISTKNEILFQRGTNFNNLPAWQRRGIAMQWETFEKEGVNPKTGDVAVSKRRRIRIDSELPVGEAFGDYVRQAVERWESA